MPFFREEEFFCPCRKCQQKPMNSTLIEKLERARAIAGIPFHINSGYRCLDHNRSVGSKDSSSHVKAMAADISTTTDNSRFSIMSALLAAGFKRIGVNMDKNFIHVDVDESKTQNIIFKY